METIIIILLIIAILLLVYLSFVKKDHTGDQLNQNLLNMSMSLKDSIIEQERETRKEQSDTINQFAKSQGDNLTSLDQRLSEMIVKNYEQSINISKTVAESLDKIRIENNKKLEEIRGTVNEKLDKTLTERLNASFETVATQLKSLYTSLGEMQKLSTDVNNLNRILTNVKSRGTWAEVHLKNILDDVIPTLYDQNVKCGEKEGSIVEFGVRIPTGENNDFYYLPIDSKFPKEDWEKLLDAREQGDVEAAKAAKKALETRIRNEAKEIKEKYINPPVTTPYAILYLATEGLYAEVYSSTDSNLLSELRDKNIMLAGPSTMIALLNSLSLGFKTIAINKKAGEVMDTLSAVKSQYEKFDEILRSTQKSITSAGNNLDKAIKRNEIITKRLKSVEMMDLKQSDHLLELQGDEIE